uniref:Spire-type actin nucleation factor 2 n=1 Tax=Paramormyrops kingsleyae TaxID=1676925 RepID=A0A3B3RQ85_9TELE
MARSANIGTGDGDSRVPAPQDRPEVRDLSDPRELSLEEVLKSYEQPINEEQAWAVCYQCCSRLSKPLSAAGFRGPARVKDPSSILLHRDGTVSLRVDPSHGKGPFDRLWIYMVQSLGVAIYRALDWGLDESEERELSPQLERLIERMVGGDEGGESTGSGVADEGYSGQDDEEEEEEEDGTLRAVCSFRQVMVLCASRLANPTQAPEHYQAVCRALFVETLELQTFLTKIRDAKEMLRKIRSEEPEEDRSTAELDALKHRDWARLWVQLMKELRQGVKLKKVQEQQFDPLPTEFRLTPFEMLMQDIRARKYQLRKVMVDGDIPTQVKRDAHDLILDFIRSRPPLKPVSERSLPPPPLEQQSLHEQILAEIKQERKLKPVDLPTFGSLPCLLHPCPHDVKSTSCIDLSVSEVGGRPLPRPRVLLKAPTLAEMEEMNLFEVRNSPTPLKRDRSFSEHDLAGLRGELLPSLLTAAASTPRHFGAVAAMGFGGVGELWDLSLCISLKEEFSHPVESLALTVDEVINVRRVLVKAEMEKFLPNKDLYNSLRKGKVCCCCKVKFPLFSWPFSPSSCGLCPNHPCLFLQMKIPSKKMAHIPVYTVGFESSLSGHSRKSECTPLSLRSLSRHSVEVEFPHLYAHGCSLRDVCSDCTKFVADVISSSRRSLDILNNTPKRERAVPLQRPLSHPQGTTRCCK